MKKQPLRIGFDLDGVLLYNPARIIRPFISLAKKILFKKKELRFYYPKSKLEKIIWAIFHKSSIFIAPGLEDIKKLAKTGQLELYIITARYSFLKKDFEKWLKKINADKSFKGYFYNKQDEQPHLFKEKMIKKLNLDVFVEDNWDIVQHLSEKLKSRIYWIYNIFDKKIDYQHKQPHLKKFIEELKQKYL